MRYWWVNQNQTYAHEVYGHYLWSPKTKANGGANPFYEYMREVSPGDVVFSFCDTRIKAIGTAARQELERLWGGKVFLELWVKVRSGWADDEARVRSFGYE